MPAGATIYLSAGEASGDNHGASLMRELKGLDPTLRLVGMGGPMMRAEGLECLLRAEDMAVVGLVEVFRRLPFYIRSLAAAESAMRQRGADLFVPIDFPDFNMRLMKRAHRADIPVVYYISPQVWAWRRGRVKEIERHVSVLLTIFPFEASYYARERLSTIYVGHPLLDQVPAGPPRGAVPAGTGTLAVMPGSRRSEIHNHMPVLAEFLATFLGRHPGVRAVIPCAPTLEPEDLARHLAGLPPAVRERVRIAPAGASTEVLHTADAALVASGTSTLQALLCNIPFAVFYRLHPVTYLVARRMIRLRHVGLVNLVAEKGICREMLQDAMNVPGLVRESEALLWDAGYRRLVLEEFDRARKALGGPGASRRAAETILKQVRR